MLSGFFLLAKVENLAQGLQSPGPYIIKRGIFCNQQHLRIIHLLSSTGLPPHKNIYTKH